MMLDTPSEPPSPTLLLSESGVDARAMYESVLAAAEEGDPTAQQQLGVMFHRGATPSDNSGEADHVQAALWFSRAAEAGLASAQCNLGLLHLLGHGVAQDDRLAVAPPRKMSVFRGAAAASRRAAAVGRSEATVRGRVAAPPRLAG